MSEAANIISTATQVPDIVRGVGAAGGADLQLANSYQFSSILRHLVDTPEKTLEAAKGPEKDAEQILRPKTVEDTRNADDNHGQDLGDQRSASDNFTEQAVPVPENNANPDDHASQNTQSPDEPAAPAPADDDTTPAVQAPVRAELAPQEDAVDDFVAAVLTPHAAPARASVPVTNPAKTAAAKLVSLADGSNGKAPETNPGQLTSNLHNAVQKNVKEITPPPQPQTAGNILKSNQEQTLAQKLGLAQALSVHVDKGIDTGAARSTPLHTLAKGAHIAQFDNSGTTENFVGGNGAKSNSNGENVASDRKATANHGGVPSDKALGQNTTADPSVNFGQSVRAQAAMAGLQQAAAAGASTKALPINVDLTNLNALGASNGPSQISQTAKANPLTAAHQPQKPPVPVEQVAVNIKNAIGEGADKINIKLHPASLGRVEIRMEIAKDGQLSAVILAEKPETLDMLRGDVRGLERALQEAGLKTDAGSLNFGLKSQNSDTAEADSEGENTHSGEPNEHSGKRDENNGNAGQLHPGIYGQNQSRNGGIDIRV
jgi:flagellar hook-length control protein FliK